MKEETQQFNVFLTSETIRQMKHLSVDEQVSLSDLVEKVFTAYIAQSASHAQEHGSKKSQTAVQTYTESQPQPTPEQGGITVQPMVHVQNMGDALSFYSKIGATVLNGSRDDDWALLRFGTTELGLLAHPANPEQDEDDVELNFEYHGSLKELEKTLSEANVTIVRYAGDEGFGAQLQIKSPDGLLVKINQLDPDLYR